MSRLLAMLLLSCGLWASWAEATPLASYTIYAMSTRDGLASNLIWTLLQDTRGFLWMGSPEGLIRYDGQEMTVFDRRNTPTFQNHNVSAIAEDPRGFFWVGTGGGGVYRAVGERIEIALQGSRLPHPEVNDLLLTAGGDLWVATRGGLCRMRGQNLRCFGLQDGLPSVWMSGDTPISGFQALAVDSRGKLWVTTSAGAAYQQGERFVPVLLPEEERPLALQLDSHGRLWAGTNRGRIGLLDEKGFQPRLEMDPSVSVTCLLPEVQGAKAWFGTLSHGIGRWDGQSVEMLERKDGLPGNQVAAMLVDREGNLWAGMGGGLTRLSDTLITQMDERNGLLGKTVIGLSVGRSGLWTVTDEGGLHLREGHRFQPVPGGMGSGPGNVRRVLQTRDGTVWVGTRQGLFRWEDGQMLPAAPPMEGKTISAIYEDDQGVLWVGTANSGLFQQTGTGWRLWDVEHGMPDHGIYTLQQSRSGGLWVGTRKGLAKIEGERLTAWLERDGLPDPLVVALHEDQTGTLWLGTVSAGLVCFKEGRFRSIQERHGLPDNTIWAILEDDFGFFWFSSNRGLNRVARAELEDFVLERRQQVSAVRYGPSDGLLEPDCIGGFLSAGIEGPDGQIYVATAGGVAIVPAPDHATETPPPPRVLILSAAVDGSVSSVSSRLELPSGSRRLELWVATPTFLASDWVRLRQRLVGFDDTWSPVGRRREITYTNLPPGEMLLEVASSRDGHTWSEPERLVLRVQPHWTQTPWFRVVAVLLAALAGLSFYRVRIGVVLRREQALASLVEDRTEALRLANLELVEKNDQLAKLTMIDPLTGLANRRRFDAALSEEWRRALRSGGWLTLIMADIDAFKRFNDTLGHPAGDACLKSVSQVVYRAARRAGELAARFGGEEFCLVLPGAPPDNAQVVAQNLCERVRALAYPHPSSPIAPVVTLSVGGASVQVHPSFSFEALLAAADAALYEAKQAGRNRFVMRVLPQAQPQAAG